MSLCNLQTVKDLLGITDTSKDSMMSIIIKITSAQIENYIGYSLSRKTTEEEIHMVNNQQIIILNNEPIQSVEKVTIGDNEITDYKLLPQYAQKGMLYRGNGWCGGWYTRGMTYDTVAGFPNIKVTYTSGYYMPDDEHYVEGASDSLPLDIQTACIEAVTERYLLREAGAEALKSHSEGGISDTWNNGDVNAMGDAGLSKKVCSILAEYKRVGVA